MYLVVNNFGPIREAKIDLNKKFYLFMGENNSGKTYLTKLLYVIFDKKVVNDFSESKYNTLSITDESEIDLNDEFISSILKDFSDYISKVALKSYAKLPVGDNFKVNFEYDFNKIESKELRSGARLTLSDSDVVDIFSLVKEKNTMTVNVDKKSLDQIEAELPDDFFDNVPRNEFRSSLDSININMTEALSFSLLRLLLQAKESPFFMPSNRVSILDNFDNFKEKDSVKKKAFAERLIELLDNDTDKNQALDMLRKEYSDNDVPSYISDIISKLKNLQDSNDEEFIKSGKSLYGDLLIDLASIMNGNIIYEKTNSLSKTYKERYLISKHDDSISLELASSSVNSTSLLYIYLKYLAKDSDNFLMIDEPEMNLHLANQALLMKLFIDFSVKNRVLIATHSPIVAEILNINILNQRSETKFESEFINQEFEADNAVVYYFSNGGIKSYSVGDYGIAFKDFNDSRSPIYSLADDIGESIFNAKSEN